MESGNYVEAPLILRILYNAYFIEGLDISCEIVELPEINYVLLSNILKLKTRGAKHLLGCSFFDFLKNSNQLPAAKKGFRIKKMSIPTQE